MAAKGLYDPNISPADRVTRERVAAYVSELSAALAPYTVLARVQELCDALRVIAPEWNRNCLRQLYRTLRAQVRSARDKFSRLKPSDELTALGERLMKEADSAPDWSARRRAVAYRDGLMISLLIYRPLRLKNLAMMRVGQHLIKVSGTWQILFAAEETKSHAPYEAVLPSALTPKLERSRRASTSPDARRADEGSGKHACGASRTRRAMGLGCGYAPRGNISRRQDRRPYQSSFRPKRLATSVSRLRRYLDRRRQSEAHRGCFPRSRLAGHTMTEKRYNHARSLEASRKHAATLAQLRRSLTARRKG